MKGSTQTQTVKDLAEQDDEYGTISGEKADAVWDVACEDLDRTVVEVSDELGHYVSESYVRKVLKTLPPEAFGL